VDFAAAESGQAADLVDDDHVDRAGVDLFAKRLVLLGLVGGGPRDDVDELDGFSVGVLSVDEGAEFVELAACVLIGS